MEYTPLMQPPRQEGGKIIQDEIKFSDIFSSAQVAEGNQWAEASPGISSYCNVLAGGGAKGFYKSLRVMPTERTIRLVRERMLQIDNDRIYFQVVVFEDEGTACVYAKYNQILGSRLLAQVDIKTVPLKETA